MIIRRILTNRAVLKSVRFGVFGSSKFDQEKDYYSALGLDKKATERQIKQAYYSLAKQYHPDAHKGMQEKFKEINEAYSVLSDQALRKQYDQARVLKNFGRKFTRRNRSSQQQQWGPDNFDFRANYGQFTAEEQQLLRKGMQRLIILGCLGVIGFTFVIFIFFRTPSSHYFIQPNGTLVAVNRFNTPPLLDQFGNPIMTPYPVTRNTNPYGVNASNNQYNPYNQYQTTNPNQHPYSASRPSPWVDVERELSKKL